MPERRIVKSEPVIVSALKKRRTFLVPRGVYREALLDFLEDVGRGLRRREVWVDAIVSLIPNVVLGASLRRLGEALGIEALKKV
jgi:hypothetical protein